MCMFHIPTVYWYLGTTRYSKRWSLSTHLLGHNCSYKR